VAEREDIAGTAADDDAVEARVLRQLLLLHPAQVTLEELVRELAADPADFAERDAIERASVELARAGLVHGSAGFVVPSRAALRFAELAGAP
jgi:hypothetical protein